MTDKFIKKGIICALLAIIFAFCGVFYSHYRFPKQQGGKFVFAQSRENEAKIKKITITTPKQKTTLVLDNNTWLVAEDDYYYANFEVVNKLFNDLRNSRFYHQQRYSQEKLIENDLLLPQQKQKVGQGTIIETFAEDNSPIDSIVIGKATSNQMFHFAKQMNKEEIWLIDGEYLLPQENYSWLMQPILQYPRSLTETVVIEEDGNLQVANRASEGYPFFNKEQKIINMEPILERLEYLITTKVASAQNFDESRFNKRRRIDLITFSGLITSIELYYNDEEYWAKISLSTTNLPTSAVNAYIKDNQFLYDGWFFKLTRPNGLVLSSFQISKDDGKASGT